MLDKKIIDIYKDAIAFEGEKEAFTSDWALSSVFEADSNVEENYKVVEKIYNLVKMNVIELAKIVGMSNRQFGFAFGIPTVTIDSWSVGKRTPPDYVKLLLAESCGYFD